MTALISFHGQDGQSLTFDDTTYILNDHRGWYAPPVQLYTERLPGLPGARAVGTVTRERLVGLDVAARAAGYDAAQTVWDTLVGTLGQDGYLESTVNGLTRRLAVLYEGGLEGSGQQTPGLHWPRAAVQYRAVAPYWYDPTEQVQSASLGGSRGATWPVTWPVFWAVPNTATEVLLPNGTAPSPWRFEAFGPFTRLTVTDVTSGAVLDVTLTVPSGQRVYWDTTYGARAVWLDTGAEQQNVTYTLSSPSTFWDLTPGPNVLILNVEGATNPNGTFRWFKQYRTAGAA